MIQDLITDLIAIVAAVVWIIVTTVIVFMIYPDHRLDLFFNLFAEFIGTIIAVLIIDFLIKWRGEKRQLPAKCLLYSKLLNMIDDLLIAILPEECREVSKRIYQCKYINICVTPMIELKVSMLIHLPLYIKRDIEIRGASYVTSLSQARKQLDNILFSSAFLLDPAPMSLLLNLEQSLDVDWKAAQSREDFAPSLEETALAAVEIKKWLENIFKRYFKVAMLDNV